MCSCHCQRQEWGWIDLWYVSVSNAFLNFSHFHNLFLAELKPTVALGQPALPKKPPWQASPEQAWPNLTLFVQVQCFALGWACSAKSSPLASPMSHGCQRGAMPIPQWGIRAKPLCWVEWGGQVEEKRCGVMGTSLLTSSCSFRRVSEHHDSPGDNRPFVAF